MGRPYGGTPTCEMCPSIDVRRWRREGGLYPGQSFPCSWTHDGEPCASINVRIEPSSVLLSFQARSSESDQWQSVQQRVPVEWTECNFGGGRPWFRCTATADGKYCGKRVAKLYLGGSAVFACRSCHRLVFASQVEPLRLRGLGKARKIRMALGGGPNILDDFPQKPKGMHSRTYTHLRSVYDLVVARL